MIAFTVSRGRIPLRVRLLPTVKEVHAAFTVTDRPKRGTVVHAFFQPNTSNVGGSIVLPLAGCTPGLISHELLHAVVHRMSNVTARADRFTRDADAIVFSMRGEERAATFVGVMTDRIWRRVRAEQVRARVGQ